MESIWDALGGPKFHRHYPEPDDCIAVSRRLHSGRPDPRGHPPWPPDKTSLQEACEALKRDCEEIKAKRAEKILSGSLEDIRERLSNGI